MNRLFLFNGIIISRLFSKSLIKNKHGIFLRYNEQIKPCYYCEYYYNYISLRTNNNY